MISQLSLKLYAEDDSKRIKPATRIRYKIPTYIKFYTIYQYDRYKFSKLLKIWLDTEEGKARTLEMLRCKQNEILNLCWKKDENGNKLRDSDEAHIFRYSTLEKIYELIYNQLGVNPFIQDNYEQEGLYISPDEGQAEILDTWKLPIKKRVIIHIRLLRLLRKGLSIKEALERIKRSGNGYRA